MNRGAVCFTAALLTALVFGSTPALAETVIEKNLSLEPGGGFDFEGEDASLAIRGTARDGARIVITSEADIEDTFDIEIEESDGRLHVTAWPKERPGWSFFGSWRSSPELRFEIELPARTDLSIGTADGSVGIADMRGNAEINTSDGSIAIRNHDGPIVMATSDGSVSLSEIRGDARVATSDGSVSIERLEGNVTASTSDGSVRVDRVTGTVSVASSDGSVSVSGTDGKISAATSDGSITITAPGGDVSAAGSDGSIRIEDAAGRVDAETTDGSISVSLAPGNGHGGRLVSSEGNIRLTLDPAVALDLDARADDGQVICSVPLVGESRAGTSHLAGRLGAGGEKLVLRAVDGSIRIDGRTTEGS